MLNKYVNKAPNRVFAKAHTYLWGITPDYSLD